MNHRNNPPEQSLRLFTRQPPPFASKRGFAQNLPNKGLKVSSYSPSVCIGAGIRPTRYYFISYEH